MHNLGAYEYENGYSHRSGGFRIADHVLYKVKIFPAAARSSDWPKSISASLTLSR